MAEEIKQNANETPETKESWILAMIEREALPTELRTESAEEFFRKYDVPKSTYYYQASKIENQEKILELSIRTARKYTSDVLDGLGKRAILDNKAAEIYLKFILQLAEKIDHKYTFDLSDKKQKALDILLREEDDQQTSAAKDDKGDIGGESISSK